MNLPQNRGRNEATRDYYLTKKRKRQVEKIPFEPFFARVVLKRERVTDKIGSIIIPESVNKNQFNPEEGILIACGDTVEDNIRERMGKKVLFAKYSGAWIKVGEDEYFICQDEDLLGAVNE